jgi:predicted nucleic acid-binding protein
MFYLDASFVVALLVPEPHSEKAERWIEGKSLSDLAVSLWVSTEISSALSIKCRTGALSVDLRTRVLGRWHQMLAESLVLVPVANPHFTTAATFADRHDLGLRAGDALHLAIASQTGATLVTFDRVLAAAALEVGVPVEPL